MRRKTVQVRIAVAVAENGEWAIANSGLPQDDRGVIEDAAQMLPPECAHVGYIVTADLPIPPPPKTIKGKVTPKGRK